MAENKTVSQLPGHAVWKTFDGNGAPAHFYHAAGFPVDVYSPMLSILSSVFKLSTLGLRATWPGIGLPPTRRDWQLYADDLIAFIEQQHQSPIVGIGHSIGATCTILAAEKQPDLFKALVLIEPAMVSRSIANLVRIIPKALMNHFESARSTLIKPDCWNSREEVHSYFNSLSVYKRFNGDALDAMVQHGVAETQEGLFQLVFPKVWEAHIYTQPPNVMRSLERLDMPCVAIRGKPSVFFTEPFWKEWQVHCPDTVFKQDLAYGHLLPLESPSTCCELIQDGLSEIA